MAENLRQSDLDDLSAYLDGELPAARAAEIGELLRGQAAWRQAHREMTAVDTALDAWTAPPPADDLAERVLAGVAAAELAPGDFEDLSAFLDGELPDERAAEVARLVRDDPLWRRTHSGLLATSAAMDTLAAPEPSADLADRILRQTRRIRRHRLVFRVVAWAGSAAAAAAVVLVTMALWNRPGPTGPQPPVADRPVQLDKELKASIAFRDVPPAERAEMEQVVVEHFNTDLVRGFFRDYDVVKQLETLEAIDRLESEGT